VLVAVAVVGGGALWYAAQRKPAAAPPPPPPTAPGAAPAAADGFRGFTLGPDAAPVEVTEFSDFECPFCALLHARLGGRSARVAFRHFPVPSKHPRAWAAACAAEAAALQARFWDMHDALYADQGRLEDPHLWARCEALGLDLERFDRDRRSEAVAERVKRDVRDALRAGATGTPTVWIAQDDGNLLDTMVTFGIRDARRIGPPTDGRARKGSSYEQ
jgi:protein-disulfide isomerase